MLIHLQVFLVLFSEQNCKNLTTFALYTSWEERENVIRSEHIKKTFYSFNELSWQKYLRFLSYI